LKFYYKYVAGIKEPESHEDEFTPADFGSVLHLALELIYSDLRNKNNLITKNLLEEKIPDSEKYVSEAFKYFTILKHTNPKESKL